MEYINLGNSGLKVSRLCLGTMNMGSKECTLASPPCTKGAGNAGTSAILTLSEFPRAGTVLRFQTPDYRHKSLRHRRLIHTGIAQNKAPPLRLCLVIH